MERQLEKLHFSHLLEARLDLMQQRADLMAQVTRIDHQLTGINAEIARIEDLRPKENKYVSREGTKG